jgi:hypothetical protein
MKELMIVVAYVISYPLFMVFSYFVARALFMPMEKIALEKHKERVTLMLKARRVKRTHRLIHA